VKTDAGAESTSWPIRCSQFRVVLVQLLLHHKYQRRRRRPQWWLCCRAPSKESESEKTWFNEDHQKCVRLRSSWHRWWKKASFEECQDFRRQETTGGEGVFHCLETRLATSLGRPQPRTDTDRGRSEWHGRRRGRSGNTISGCQGAWLLGKSSLSHSKRLGWDQSECRLREDLQGAVHVEVHPCPGCGERRQHNADQL